MSDLFSDTERESSQDLAIVNADLVNTSEVTGESTETYLTELAQQIISFKLDYLSERDSYQQQLQRLRSQLQWSLGILFLGTAVFATLIVWLIYTLKPNPRAEIAREASIALEQVTALKNEVRSLQQQLTPTQSEIAGQKQQLQTLTQKIETVDPAKLTELQEQLDRLETTVNTRQESLNVLVEALQKLITVEPPTPTSPSQSPPIKGEKIVQD